MCMSMCAHAYACVVHAHILYVYMCMLHRWSNTGNTLHQPHPQVVAHKLLGGVDQATLRQSLSRGDSNQLVYIMHMRSSPVMLL